MECIVSKLTESLAKKILANKDTAIKYLQELDKEIDIPELRNTSKKWLSDNAWKLVVKYWNYEVSKNIIRKLFTETEKYKRGKESAKAVDRLMKEWKELGLGKIEWSFSQGKFDDFVQRINSLSENGIVKDEKVKLAAVKYRRLKEINTARNDYIETLIFEKNENIVPTLSHKHGVDFFVNGVSYDQKVSRSPTNEFIRDFGGNWREYAKQNPSKVAEYLYRYQDEGRFGSDPRFYVVYLNEEISIFELKNKIDEIDISQPLEVTFEYKHKIGGLKTYKTSCFVILLS